jgi:hypothetical protein
MGGMGFDVDYESAGAMLEPAMIQNLCAMNYYIICCFQGHSVVAFGMDENYPYSIYYMNPDFGGKVEYNTYSTFSAGTVHGYGSWSASVIVKDYDPTAIGDIRSFAAQLDGSNVRLTFEISEDADPAEKGAVYIADNPAGPARLIETLVDSVVYSPLINVWYDQWRYEHDNDYYYYYLDHSYAPFAETRLPTELRDTREAPVYYCAGYCDPRPVLSPPEAVTVTDVPGDFGLALHVAWSIPECDSLLDCYNIYRMDSVDAYFYTTYQYVASVPPGTSEFIDNTVNNEFYCRYKVSSAHHGYHTTVPPGCFAIWNDFSVPSTGLLQSINNMASAVLSFPSPDYSSITGCPGGDADTIRVAMTIMGADSTPTSGIPADEMMLLVYEGGDLSLCAGDTIWAATDTDEYGTTEFKYSTSGGCDSVIVQGRVYGKVTDNTLEIGHRSPDLDGDCQVILSDNAIFGLSYNSSIGDSSYNECCDFTWDDKCNLSDFACLGEHYTHCTPAGSPYLYTGASLQSDAILRMTSLIDTETDRLQMTMTVENASDASLVCFALDFDWSGIEYIEFIKHPDFPNEVVAVPIVKEGKRLVFVSTFAGKPIGEDDVEIGTVEYRIDSSDETFRPEEHIRLAFADIMYEVRGTTRISSMFTRHETECPPIYRNNLSSNYPNPFNPSTVIEYSISANSYVNLSIYDVSGKLIRTLVAATQKRDVYRIVWDGKDGAGTLVASGVYFYRLRTNAFSDTKKLVILR